MSKRHSIQGDLSAEASPLNLTGRPPLKRPSGLLARTDLVLFLANLLAITLARKRFLHTLLLTWFQVKRVTLDFLDDVLGLNLALEAAQRVLERLTFLYTNFCQEKYTSSLP